MRKLRKYYIDYVMKYAELKHNEFASDDGQLDEIAIRYIENICDYIVKGIH